MSPVAEGDTLSHLPQFTFSTFCVIMYNDKQTNGDKMQHPDILKITGDYGIRKPIYISTVKALKHVRGQMLFEELNPGMYHRSTVRSWLWKNRASKYIEDAKLTCPEVHMNNHIHSYSTLERELQFAVERWINNKLQNRFESRHNSRNTQPVFVRASDSMPSVSFTIDSYDLRDYTKTSILALQRKLNDVCRQHKLTKKKNKQKALTSNSNKLFNKWYGVNNGTRLPRFS